MKENKYIIVGDSSSANISLGDNQYIQDIICYSNNGEYYIGLDTYGIHRIYGVDNIHIENIDILTNKLTLTSQTGSVKCNFIIENINKENIIPLEIYDYGLSIINFIVIVILYILPYYMSYKLAIFYFLKNKND